MGVSKPCSKILRSSAARSGCGFRYGRMGARAASSRTMSGCTVPAAMSSTSISQLFFMKCIMSEMFVMKEDTM